MITFDLEKQEQGDWFSFFDSIVDKATGEIKYLPPEPDAAEFCVRLMVPFYEERRRKMKKESTFAINPVTRAMEKVVSQEVLTSEEEFNENQDAWDYAILDFRNVLDAKGNNVTCTRDTKLALVRIPKVNRFFARVFQILSGEAAKMKEEAVKN
jgi:hypothetical protein